MKIAVVDDQKIVCSMFEEILKIENYAVECFDSAEAFAVCRGLEDFDCLLVE